MRLIIIEMFITALLWFERIVLRTDLTAPTYLIWGGLHLEVLVISTVLLFLVWRLVHSANHFRQLILLLLLITLLCVYLAYYQLELLACFMFLAEFTVLFFFYVLFLHLRVLTWQPVREVLSTNGFFLLLMMGAALMAFFGFTYHTGVINIYPVVLNVYKLGSLSLVSDMVFMWGVFFKHYVFLHLCVGIILLFLTLFIFTAVSVYCYINLTGATVDTTVGSKLNTHRGLTEQTGELSQKAMHRS